MPFSIFQQRKTRHLASILGFIKITMIHKQPNPVSIITLGRPLAYPCSHHITKVILSLLLYNTLTDLGLPMIRSQPAWWSLSLILQPSQHSDGHQHIHVALTNNLVVLSLSLLRSQPIWWSQPKYVAITPLF